MDFEKLMEQADYYMVCGKTVEALRLLRVVQDYVDSELERCTSEVDELSNIRDECSCKIDDLRKSFQTV